MLLVLILIEICGIHSPCNVWRYYINYVGFIFSHQLCWFYFLFPVTLMSHPFFPFFENVVVTLLGFFVFFFFVFYSKVGK